ncbi:MAG: hypothetical protein H0X08_03665 [Blastocatellia bacterium]|nr:hypothetical protein [Blastocatellia bacterium]
MNIFEEQKFYPTEETPIKEHYSASFDSVFLAFIPFFKIDEAQINKSSFQRVHQITYPQFKNANPDLNLPKKSFSDVYTNENPEYPTDDEIRQYGTKLSWKEVKR